MQAAVIDRAGDDADIGGAFRHQADDLVGEALLEIDADVGIGHQERTQRLRQELGERVGIGQHPHLAGEPARIRRQVFPQTVGLRQDSARVLQQRAPGRRRHDALAAAHQQFGAESEFHFADAGRSRGERQIGARRTMRDAARLDDVAEKIEIREIEAHWGTTFLFREGRLHKTHIAPKHSEALASSLKK